MKLLELKSAKANLFIIDLRKKEDFAKGHIKGSHLATFDEHSLLVAPRDATIVLVSYDEEQSKKMAEALSKSLDVYYLAGGLKNWPHGLYCTNISYVGTDYP